jgi:hypothetical protein
VAIPTEGKKQAGVGQSESVIAPACNLDDFLVS